VRLRSWAAIMTRLASVVVLASLATGCGTILNKKTVNVSTQPGASVSGGGIARSQQEDVTITYDDGGSCTLESGVSVGYVILNIFLTGPIGLIVDGVTGNWKILKGDCRLVSVDD
jgi:hypothetical protein